MNDFITVIERDSAGCLLSLLAGMACVFVPALLRSLWQAGKELDQVVRAAEGLEANCDRTVAELRALRADLDRIDNLPPFAEPYTDPFYGPIPMAERLD